MERALLFGISFGSDVLGSIADLAMIGGTLVLVLVLVAFGGFVYKSLRGDGIRWPGDVDEKEAAEDGVRNGRKDEEWKYY